MNRPWVKVVFAADCELCEECEEPICEACDMHYAECPCPGPHQDEEYDYDERLDGLYARRKRPS